MPANTVCNRVEFHSSTSNLIISPLGLSPPTPTLRQNREQCSLSLLHTHTFFPCLESTYSGQSMLPCRRTVSKTAITSTAQPYGSFQFLLLSLLYMPN